MNVLKEEYYRVYSKCLSINLNVEKAQQAAKLYIENYQGRHSLKEKVFECLKKKI